MYFRFGMAVALVVAVSLVGVAIERTNLEYRRLISRQHYELEALRSRQAELRLRTQQLGAPARMVESIRSGRLSVQRPTVEKVSRWKTVNPPQSSLRKEGEEREGSPRNASKRSPGKRSSVRKPSRYPLLRWQRRE